MIPSDARDRDRILKMLRRRPFDPNAPIKPTTPELMTQLTETFTTDYAEGVETRAQQSRAFTDIDRKGKP